jgi:hypothetical protein
MKFRIFAPWALSLLLIATVFAPADLWSQDQSNSSCTMAGTWYGGGPLAKYMITVIQTPGGTFTMMGYAAFTQVSLGYPVTTTFSDSIIKARGKGWEFFGTGMVNTSALFPAPNPELWALHGKAHLSGCDTLQLDYDFFGAYFMPTDKKPFLSVPDYVVVPPPFSETYQRMPTTCTQCGDQ